MKRANLNFWIDLISLLLILGLLITGGVIYWVLPPGTGHTHQLFGFGRHDIGKIHFYLAFVTIVLFCIHLALHWNWICCIIGRAVGNPRPSDSIKKLWGVGLLLLIPSLLAVIFFWSSDEVKQILVSKMAHTESYQPASLCSSSNESSCTEDSFFIANNKQTTLGRAVAHSQENRSKRSNRTGRVTSRRHKHKENCAAGVEINGQTTLLEVAQKSGFSLSELRMHLGLPKSVALGQRLGRLKGQYGLSIHRVREIVCDGN